MADEPEAIAPTPETAAETPSGQPAADPTENLQAEQPEEQSDELANAPAEDDEFEEFEWNGKPLKAPKGLKDGVLMHADYTKKTQEVAAQRRELEATAKRAQEQIRAYNEDLEVRAEFISVKKQLEQYRQVNWQEYAGQDPVAAQQHYIAFQQLQEQARTLETDIQQRATKRTEEAQLASREAEAKRIQETQDFARKNIKGWTPETDKQVIDFAVSKGVDIDDLKAAMNPTIYQILHLAALGEKALKQPVAAPAKPAPVPLQTVSARGNAPARKSPADMDMDEYVAYRRKQMAAKG